MSRTHSTFWIYLQQMLAGMAPADKVLSDEIAALLNGFATQPLASQHQEAARLFEIMAELPMGHELAFQLGSRIPLTAYAPLAIPMKFAPTIGDSLQFLCKYLHLQAPLISAELKRVEGGACISLDFRLPVPDHVDIFLAAGAFAAIGIEISLITGRTHNFSAISLRQCPANYLPLFKKHFGITPETGSQTDLLTISQKVLSAPNPFADPMSFQRYQEEYEEQLRDSLASGILSDQIRQHFMAQIGDPPKLQDLATQLNMSERQLRFALAKENTNYRELLMQCRVDYARIQLANPRLSISKLAQKLGYSDITAFNHGFKRWTGMTPSEFQKNILSK